ncbi:hypothetical protein [Providencia rettgeri]|uniref:Uncharacterized protein n=1 Tax=Providencia rettgeri TaxID=587 RepID=A0A379FX00_PRORE|nr:Uncharacterised protein [Providencia rettgeri]
MVIMMHLDLPKNAGFALRHAPSEQQQAFLAVIENWSSNVGQSTQSYSAQLKAKIEQMVAVWGGIWLNPKDDHQKLKLQCAQGHLINAHPFSLRQGVWCAQCYIDSKRYSIAIMQTWAAQRQGICLSTAYINSNSKLTWQCEQSHTWEASADSVKMGRWYPQCLRVQQQAQYLAEIKAMAKARGENVYPINTFILKVNSNYVVFTVMNGKSRRILRVMLKAHGVLFARLRRCEAHW